MPEEEKKRRAEGLKRQVREYTIEEWAEAQLKDIAAYREHYG